MSRAVALLAALVVVAACRTPSPGIPMPLDDPRPAALLEALSARVEQRSALRAKAKLDLTAPDLRLSRPQRLAVERPARMRVEVLGLFDQVAAVVVTDGASYQLYDARRHELEEGPVDADLLWRVARVDLVPAEAVDLVLGAPQPDAALEPRGARLYEDGAIAFVGLDEAGVAREAYRFDALGRLTEAARSDTDGRLIWRARFDDYRSVEAPGGGGEESFAHDVLLEFPRVEARVRLDFDQVALAETLPDELFTLDLPGSPRPTGTQDGPDHESGL